LDIFWPFGSWTFGSVVFRACLVAKSDISQAPAISVEDIALRYECQTTTYTKLINVYFEHFFARVYGLGARAQKYIFQPDIGTNKLFNARAGALWQIGFSTLLPNDSSGQDKQCLS